MVILSKYVKVNQAQIILGVAMLDYVVYYYRIEIS